MILKIVKREQFNIHSFKKYVTKQNIITKYSCMEGKADGHYFSFFLIFKIIFQTLYNGFIMNKIRKIIQIFYLK